jgi:hypothetical protein
VVRLEHATGQARAAAEELREVIREAHGLSDDLERLLRECRAHLGQGVQDLVVAEVGKQAQRLAKDTDAAIKAVERRIGSREGLQRADRGHVAAAQQGTGGVHGDGGRLGWSCAAHAAHGIEDHDHGKVMEHGGWTRGRSGPR